MDSKAIDESIEGDVGDPTPGDLAAISEFVEDDAVRSGTIAEKFAYFKRVALSLKNGNWYYIIINHIDPDSLASAIGMRHLLRRLGINRVKILYNGEVGQGQNTLIVYQYNLLEEMIILSQKVIDEFTNKDVYILVDSSSPFDKRLNDDKVNGFEAAGKFNPQIVIDHHRNEHPVQDPNKFIWVEDGGSCSTMIIELIEQIGFDFSHKDDEELPILLSLGIYTDTESMVYSDGRDCLAYAKVHNFVDKAQLQLFINYPLSDAYIFQDQYAYNHRTDRGSIVVASVGSISSKDLVNPALIADKHIRRTGKTLAVVWAWVDKEELHIFVRSSDNTAPLAGFLHERFHDGGAKLLPGGKISKGAVQIPASFGIFGESSEDHILAVLGSLVEEKIFGSAPKS